MNEKSIRGYNWCQSRKINTFNFKDYYVHGIWNSNPINKKL